jgi:hypothetical protein
MQRWGRQIGLLLLTCTTAAAQKPDANRALAFTVHEL